MSCSVSPRARFDRTSHNRRLSGGFPHSDIPGSKGALASPGLIAECHVLHRLLLPRHPPNALIALDPIQKKTGPFARGPGSEPLPAACLVGSRLDPMAPLSRAPSASGNDLAIDAAFSVSVIDLERLSWLPCRFAPRGPKAPEPRNDGRVRTPTRAGPRTSRVIALFTMSVAGRCHPASVSSAAISRSDRKAHQGEPASHIASPPEALFAARGWWSLPGSNR